MRQDTRAVATTFVALAAMMAMVGCSSDPDVGSSEQRKEKKEYEDAGVVSPPDAGQVEEGCTLTPGYWKNHEEDWENFTVVIDGRTLTQDDLLPLLKAPTVGDASITLWRHLIAAILNVEIMGATPIPEIAEAIAFIEALLDPGEGLILGLTPRTAGRAEALELAAALAAYNEGRTGPGHCDSSN